MKFTIYNLKTKIKSQILKNKKDFPVWIQFDATKLEGKTIASPQRGDVESSIDPQMIVEYYSR